MSIQDLLRLVPAFDAIMEERNISRAAKRLGVSQSALSQSLDRLRVLLQDDLFDRTGHGMRPTARALEVAGGLKTILAIAHGLVSSEQEPLTLQRTFRIEVGAGFDALLIVPILKRLRAQAPQVRVEATNRLGDDLLRSLKAGEIDFALHFGRMGDAGYRCEVIASSDPVVIARPDHPQLSEGLTASLYTSLPQIAVAWGRPTALSAVQLEHSRLGLETNVFATVPTLAGLASAVEKTDMIATVGRAVAVALSRRWQLAIHPVPVRISKLTMYLLWHERFDHDPAHRWFRTFFLESVAAEAAALQPTT